MPKIIVFDLNETLLDLGALDPVFERVFGEAQARGEWFDQVIQSMLLTIVINVYSPFGIIMIAALEMIAERRQITVTDAHRHMLREAALNLPPHADVRDPLIRLREEGLHTAVLTNSTRDVAEAQLEKTGLRDLFDKVYSADMVRRLKPTAKPYQMVAERLNVKPDQIRFVAAHHWDVAGAMRAGCTAAFVQRPGKVLDPLAKQPDIIGVDLPDVVEQVLKVDVY